MTSTRTHGSRTYLASSTVPNERKISCQHYHLQQRGRRISPHSALSCGDVCPPATSCLVSARVHGLRATPHLEGTPAVVAVELPIRLIKVAAAIAPTLETSVNVGIFIVFPRRLGHQRPRFNLGVPPIRIPCIQNTCQTSLTSHLLFHHQQHMLYSRYQQQAVCFRGQVGAVRNTPTYYQQGPKRRREEGGQAGRRDGE
jgi:hypothetical protein